MEKQQQRSLGDKEVIVIGAGGHSKVVVDILKKSGRKIKGILDDNSKNENILGKLDLIGRYKDDCEFIIAIGNNETRKKIAEKYRVKYTTAIHPTVIIAEDVEIDDGTVVMAGAIINSGTVIGNHCIINTGAIIDHDNKLENFVHVSPGVSLAGNVSIGEKSWIGIGSTIIQGIKIFENSIVGAGSVVIRNVSANVLVVGNPAKVIKNIEKRD